MTSRQARRERREAERKAKKAELKRIKAEEEEALSSYLSEEFSEEFIAEAQSLRDRIHRRAGLHTQPAHFTDSSKRSPERSDGSNPPGFIPQTTSENDSSLGAPSEASGFPGFVPQKTESTSKRAEINRANAQHSTGPRSSTGKLASSRNSLKHGLASGEVIIPGEDPSAFDALLHNLLEEHQPANPTEELLINDMARSHWLTQRAIRLQNECFTEAGVDERRLSLFLRYQTTHERAFYKALHTLIKLKKERAHGFVSQTAVERDSSTPSPERSDGSSGFVLEKIAQLGTLDRPENEFAWKNPPETYSEAA